MISRKLDRSLRAGTGAASRRIFLRGSVAGAAIALPLPFLESLAPRRAHAAPPPKRFVYFHKPLGMSAFRADPFCTPGRDHWTPATVGRGYQITPLLQGFADRGLKDDITVISGVHNEVCGRMAEDATTTVLTPFDPITVGTRQFETSGGGRSLDLVIADRIGAGTRFSSLALGVHLNSNTIAPFANYVSFTSARTPNPPQSDPVKAWLTLFGAGVGAYPAASERLRRKRLSVLDAVRGHAAFIRQRLGAADRPRLDAHLESLRDLERRIVSSTGPATVLAPPQPPVRKDDSTNLPVNTATMLDLLVAALAFDLSRSATFMLCGGHSDAIYPFLGLGSEIFVHSHHAMTNDPAKIEATDKIDTWQNTQIAELVSRLKAVPEGDGTLLDSTVVLAGSNLASGWGHNMGGSVWGGECVPRGPNAPLDWAYVLAGGTHYFRHGSHVRYRPGQVVHTQILEACHEAVTGARSAGWMPAKYDRGTVAPGLRGDTSPAMY